ncbi:MAG: hypothetical protein JRI68_24190 [Deltaproteobacteria bacterium]|nr:hypothetical protein [Deltaproteobacteria bacterium]
MRWLQSLLGTAAVAMALTATTASSSGRNVGLGVVVVGAKGKITATHDVTLTGNVRWRGPKATFEYQWSTTDGPALPYGIDLAFKTLTIPKGDLQGGERYRLRLQVTALWEEPDADPPTQTTVVTGDISFEVNTPPHGGDCTMAVRWVGPMQAALDLKAPGWTDDDKIQYRYVLKRNGREVVLKNWSHQSRLSAASLARPGDKLQAKCMVRDKLGDGAQALSKEVERPQAKD